ncbi:DUF3080 family protein [Halioxenophilus sp. WMMB6]|uniref:DUF3080 family protein n=1 Tax=Halioxenophilus sp. WMMB6 TaxID=3073815 RepID=UPI00295F21A6|nr:DUF3080 family protein [Halioxenophilus sp. WMMB6]
MRFWAAVPRLLLPAIAGLLAGCPAPAPEQALVSDYRVRLAHVLDVATPDLAQEAASAYPSRRELTLSQQPIKIDLLEFLRLSPCQVQRLIGERNASLGHVMPPSQQWLYESKFIIAGRHCLAQLLRNPDAVELQNTLQQALAVKQAERGRVAWNAVFASQEFQSLFSLSGQPLALDQPPPSALFEALAQLQWQIKRWQTADVPPSDDIEKLYQVIGADNWYGQLMASLVLLNNELEALVAIQTERLAGRPLCFGGRSNREAEAMQNVFMTFYIGAIQPYLARVYQQGEVAVRQLNQLRDLVQPPAEVELADFDSYWLITWDNSVETSLWGRYNWLLDRHTRLWQEQLSQCGLMPRG